MRSMDTETKIVGKRTGWNGKFRGLRSYRIMLFAISVLMISSATVLVASDVEEASAEIVSVGGINYELVPGNPDTAKVVAPDYSEPYSGDIIIESSVRISGQDYPVTEIDEDAFVYCTDLKSIQIPDSVTKIDSILFEGCIKLVSISVGEGNLNYSSVGGVLFDKSMKTLLRCPGGASGEYVVPDGVVTIGRYAFLGCVSVTSVQIPDSVTSVGAFAFYDCKDIGSMVMPHVTDIGDGAFEDCVSLTSVSMPDAKTIGEGVFYGCESLITVTVPSGVSIIHDDVFDGCSSLVSIYVADENPEYSSVDGVLFDKGMKTLLRCPEGRSGTYAVPDGTRIIEEYAFYQCMSIVSVDIPYGVTSIGESAFEDCTSLTSVKISDGMTSIGAYAFYFCRSLTSVNIPGSVMSIGVSAFEDCISLVSVTIPSSVVTIHDDVFDGCASLVSINIEGTGGNYSSVDGVLFDKDMTTLIRCPEGRSGAYTVPDGTIRIAEYAFYYCESLTSVTIPSTVTKIDPYVFVNCTALGSISVDDGNPNYCSLDGVLFDKDMTTLIRCPEEKSGGYEIPSSVTRIDDYAFFGCDGLRSISAMSNVTEIGKCAFQYCGMLSSITVPEVRTIGNFAFSDCTSIEHVSLPKVQTIGDLAFQGCRSLKSITIPDDVAIGQYSFINCPVLKSITITGEIVSGGILEKYFCISGSWSISWVTFSHLTIDSSSPMSIEGMSGAEGRSISFSDSSTNTSGGAFYDKDGNIMADPEERAGKTFEWMPLPGGSGDGFVHVSNDNGLAKTVIATVVLVAILVIIVGMLIPFGREEEKE